MCSSSTVLRSVRLRSGVQFQYWGRVHSRRRCLASNFLALENLNRTGGKAVGVFFGVRYSKLFRPLSWGFR